MRQPWVAYRFDNKAKAILVNMANAETTQTIRKLKFDNGFTLVHEEMPWLPSVSFELLMPVGAAGDPEGQEGSAAVLNDWLYRGAGKLDSRQLSDTLDVLGVRRGGGVGSELSSLSAAFLGDALPQVLKLYADIVRRPSLDAEEFEPARSVARQELASLDDNPTQRLFIALSREYFASGQGRSSYGTPAGLTALSAQSVAEDFKRRLLPDGMILSVAGGVSWDELLKEVVAAFGDWQGQGPKLPEVKLNPAHNKHIRAETTQTQIGVAFKAVAPGAPGWYENALATSVLSGGMGSRLFTEVREKRGLVYSVAAVNRAVKGFGYTLGYAGTTPDRAEETLDVLLSELRRLREGVSAAELERARTGILSQLVMQGESSGSRASSLAKDSYLLGKPRSLNEIKTAIEALSLDDVNRFLAGQEPAEFTVLTLGPNAIKTMEIA